MKKVNTWVARLLLFIIALLLAALVFGCSSAAKHSRSVKQIKHRQNMAVEGGKIRSKLLGHFVICAGYSTQKY
jgi:archaellum component FlaG (FlaF/FlaG flagellin family)